LPKSEIKKFYKNIKKAIKNGDKINQNDIISAGKNLLDFQEKDTKMTLFHQACCFNNVEFFKIVRKLRGTQYLKE
jgi:hypothetical protein